MWNREVWGHKESEVAKEMNKKEVKFGGVRFINLTPHEIKIITEGGELSIPPSGTIARVKTIERDAGTLAGIPVVSRQFGEVENLPDPEEGIAYIVSALVLEAAKGRDDVYAPDTGPTAIRNESGQIMAVTRLIKAGN